MSKVLAAIVVSQFLCTSLWFAGNAVMPDLIAAFNLRQGFVANLTTAVQFGFISGTLVFAIFSVADRVSPVKVFFTCSVIAALANLGMCISGISAHWLFFFRFLTGFFLAGIYPVGMKIASDHFPNGLGKALGFLVGALVLGTALPHLIRALGMALPWMHIMFSVSAFALAGGLIMRGMVADGQYRKAGPKFQLTAFLAGFKNKNFRAAAFGYFGHMWELYSFWAFVPAMLTLYYRNDNLHLPVSFLSFIIIAAGAPACALSGLLVRYIGAHKIAMVCLCVSGACCLLSPFIFMHASPSALIAFLIIWGMAAVADSPLFSALAAQNSPGHIRGTALTIVNCIGFSVTIISIQAIKWLTGYTEGYYVYLWLAPGPLVAAFIMYHSGRSAARTNAPALT